MVPPCGGFWQQSLREFLFDRDQGHLSTLNQIVHTKDGAVAIDSTDQWWGGDTNFQNNPKKTRPSVAATFQRNLRDSVVKPTMKQGVVQSRLVLPEGCKNLVNYWVRGDLLKPERHFQCCPSSPLGPGTDQLSSTEGGVLGLQVCRVAGKDHKRPGGL